MRVTQTMMQNNMLKNLFQSQSQMDKYMNQIISGKKITKPSEDPVIAMKGMGYRTEVAEVEQFRRNASEAWSWLDHSDDVLDKATKAVQRMEYLAVQASNGTYGVDERTAISEEVKQLRDQLVDLANTQVNGKHIFNGTNTHEKPINDDYTINYDPANLHMVNIEASKGIQFQVNVSPEKMFNQDLFDHINTFIDRLEGTGDDDLNASIGELNQGMLNIVNGRAELGARMNRLELVEDRLSYQEIIAKDTMAKNEGVDFEEAVTNLITQEVIHRAALSAGAKIIQPSLIDFLR